MIEPTVLQFWVPAKLDAETGKTEGEYVSPVLREMEHPYSLVERKDRGPELFFALIDGSPQELG